jgi:hypothetical protein
VNRYPVFGLALCLLLVACGGESAPTPDLVATLVVAQRAAAATLTAEAPTETHTPSPTNTPWPTTTPWPTNTPAPTRTPEPTATSTPEPAPASAEGLALEQPIGCAPIPGVEYGTLDVDGPPADRPAGQHADLNLALRGYEATGAHLGLVEYGGSGDPQAPQLYTLFADQRVPAYTTVHQVYDWDWGSNCRGDLLTHYEVTLGGMGVAPGEVLHLPDSGCNIGSGYEALVLYATAERITLKYTPQDNVVLGYTVHVENVCVEPSLLALYQAWNDAGRGELPALRGGQPFGRARGDEIGVAIRDGGTFLDPRSRQDWCMVPIYVAQPCPTARCTSEGCVNLRWRVSGRLFGLKATGGKGQVQWTNRLSKEALSNTGHGGAIG